MDVTRSRRQKACKKYSLVFLFSKLKLKRRGTHDAPSLCKWASPVHICKKILLCHFTLRLIWFVNICRIAVNLMHDDFNKHYEVSPSPFSITSSLFLWGERPIKVVKFTPGSAPSHGQNSEPQTINKGTSHLLPCSSTPGHSRGNHRNSGEMVKFWYLFFARGRGELFSVENDFAGPRGLTISL